MPAIRRRGGTVLAASFALVVSGFTGFATAPAANAVGLADLPPIRINEVQAGDVHAGDTTGGEDWVELTNIGSQPVDITGYTLADDSDGSHQLVVGDVAQDVTALAPGAFAAYLVSDPDRPGNFDLRSDGDAVRLYLPGAYDDTTGSYDNADLVDSFVYEDPATGAATEVQSLTQDVSLPDDAWPQDANGAPVTYARCIDPGGGRIVADGTGGWTYTYVPTFGAANQCANDDPSISLVTQNVVTADYVDLGQNVSGLFYQPGTTPADDSMWAVQSGGSGLAGDPGSLYNLVPTPDGSSGTWGPATGWEQGVPIRYENGPGEPNAKGVTAVDGEVYVASDRDNTNSGVSKNTVLEVDPIDTPAAGDDLVATHEWDLTDLPGERDAGPGTEGITFVPGSYLTNAAFKDEAAGQTYESSQYPRTVADGVFVIGSAQTGDLYAYVFNNDNTTTLIATIPSGFPTVQEVQWDPSQHALLAVCGSSCQGQSSVLQVDENTDPDEGTFQITAVHRRPTGATDNLDNDGFTLQPASECENGIKQAFWSDGSDDAGHWLRSAPIDCTDGIGSTGVTITTDVSGTPSASGWYNAPVTVSFTCTDVDAVLTAACPSPVTISSTTAAQTIATITDTLGNSYDVDVPAINIDRTAPNIWLTDGPTTWVNASDATFAFSSNEQPNVVFQCVEAAGETAHDCSSPYTLSGLTDGAHKFGVTAVDRAGNVSTAASRTFHGDTVKPTLRITGVRKNATYLGTGPKPGCSGSDALSGLPSPCTLKITRTLTSVEVVATAKDRAGNVATTSLAYHTVPYYLAGATYRNGSFTVKNGRTYSVHALATKQSAVTLLGPVGSGKELTGAGTQMKYVGKVDGYYEYQASRKFSIGSGTWQLGVRHAGTTNPIKIHK